MYIRTQLWRAGILVIFYATVSDSEKGKVNICKPRNKKAAPKLFTFLYIFECFFPLVNKFFKKY